MGRKKSKLKGSKKTERPKVKEKVSFKNNPKLHKIIIVLLAFIVYANTLGHNYAQDDAIVIYDNMFTQKGIQGIPGLLSHDTFYGFFKEEGKANLVSGGRYRPLTPMMFAVEWQLFGRNPFINHLVNVLLYALLGLITYLTLALLFKSKSTSGLFFTFLASALYITHPLHTEVVANIKGRDEIVSMLCSLLATYLIFKSFDSKKIKYSLYGGLALFIGLLSKENAITFLAVIPLALMLFRKSSFIQSIKASSILFLSAGLFMLIRISVLGFDFGGTPNELMNNPFIKWSDGTWIPFAVSEKFATIFFTLGKYIQLLVLPHPLSHDYYPRAIDIMAFSDWKVLLSLFGHILLLTFAIISWKKDKYLSFGIFFYLLTLSIVSNIVFPIGTNMSERFMFMPSLGFAIVVARLLTKHIKSQQLLFSISALLILAYSFKTVTRNNVWKDDLTLFTSDVNESTRSAKLLNAAGGALSNEASKLPDGPEKTKLANESISHLQKAIQIHPTYRNAYLLMGNSLFYAKRYSEAIDYYERCLQISPGYKEVLKNYPIVLREGGKHHGQVTRNFDLAEEWLSKSYNMNPKDFETCRLLGITYGIKGQHNKAIDFFTKALEINPNAAVVHASLGTAYLNQGNIEMANKYFNTAKQIDPKSVEHLKK